MRSFYADYHEGAVETKPLTFFRMTLGGIPAPALKTYIMLLALADEEGKATASRSELASLLDLSETASIDRHVKYLAEQGYIVVERKKAAANTYHLRALA